MIKRILNTKNINYTSNLSTSNLKQQIEDVFEQTNLSFLGEFTSQNKFTAYDKWTYITWYVPKFKRKTAYLEGEILESKTGALVKLTVKPNPVIAAFPVLTILIGIITIIVSQSTDQSKQTVIFGLILIAVGVFFYLLGMFLLNRLQNNFTKHLNLQKV
ncbi:hypothetical protein [Bizionia myxarmorum]|uniref:Uncharacterized protein n=1 Tax=Bizionia myxarmorum TaxID=291186 RepID=A0A5D0R5W5_9FLAO|nr:hypothetical protein [Bizionia myxarmorum]TYB76932.1 hypothetical protein ES674_09520 [Bizionia myxarmorum]